MYTLIIKYTIPSRSLHVEIKPIFSLNKSDSLSQINTPEFSEAFENIPFSTAMCKNVTEF